MSSTTCEGPRAAPVQSVAVTTEWAPREGRPAIHRWWTSTLVMTIPLVLGVTSIAGCSIITKGVRAEKTRASSSPRSHAGASTTRTTLTTPTAVAAVTPTTTTTTPTATSGTATGLPGSAPLHGMVVASTPVTTAATSPTRATSGQLIWNGREERDV